MPDSKQLPPPAADLACEDAPDVRALRGIFLALTLLLLLWTVLAQASVAMGLPFDRLSATYAGSLCALAGALGFRCWRRRASGTARADATAFSGALAALVGLCLLTALLALWVCRPDADDWDYLHRAARALAAPHEALGIEVTGLAVDTPYRHAVWLPATVELLWAWLARWTGQPLLTVYHVWVPALVAALVPAAWYLLLSLFTRSRWSAVLGVGSILLFLTLSGETHRSPGNFAFVRIWQNKVILIALVLPLVTYFGLRYLAGPTSRRWLCVAAVLAAATGLGVNALTMLPPFLVILAASHAVDQLLRKQTPDWRALAALGLALAYPLACTAAYLAEPNPGFRTHKLEELGDVLSFPYHFWLVFGSFELSAALVAFCALLCARGGSAWRSRFPLIWSAVATLLLLNPLSYAAIDAFAGGYKSSYWRFFFLLPVPLLVAAGPVPWFERLVERGRPTAALGGLALMLALSLAYNLLLLPGNVYGTPRKAFAAHKVEPEWQLLERFAAATGPGAILAPEAFAMPWPIVDPDAHLVVTYLQHVHGVANLSGDRAFADRRLGAQRFTAEGRNKDATAFETALVADRIGNVALAPEGRTQVAQEILARRGFRLAILDEAGSLYVRE